VYWTGQPLTLDEREYLALGRSVARGEGFHYPADEPSPGTSQQFGRAPGYPAFLSLLRVKHPVDHAPRRVQIAQAALGALAVWVIAAITRRAAGPRAGVAAAAAAAVYPPLVWLPAYALSETLYSLLALGGVLALQSAADDDGAGPALVGAGLLSAAAVLVRPAGIFFVAFAAFWLALRSTPPRRRTRLGLAAVYIAAAALCLIPWMARNHRVYGRWMIASEGGATFWTGNHPLAIGEGDLAANPDLKRADLAFRRAHPGLTPEQLEPLYYRDAFDWIAAHPARWCGLIARKAFFTIVPIGPSYGVHSPRYRIASVVSYVAALGAAIVGWRRWRGAMRMGAPVRAPAALWLAAAATLAAGLVFMPQERFRIPVIDPALIATGALAAHRRP
jgi:hypothetical protein